MEAEEPKKLPYNVPGKYYTTDLCDGCAYCAAVAPDNFDFEKTSNTYFVARQPRGGEEEEFIQEAMDDCPVDAIRACEELEPQGHR
ncbi:MAG TPA: ferredoxin [Bacteroidota bacterium]|nr:ferredoxin [Bacteroidota bacterium]